LAVRAILYIIERDFRRFFRYKWWLAGMISMNLADLFIMALVYTKMVVFVDYFKFFSPGITITALFAAAFMIGREVNWEVRRDYYHYLLSLPVKRWELALGRVLSGALRGMVYMAPLLLITFMFLGFPDPLQFLLILFVLFLITLGISGLSITIATSTSNFEKFAVMRGVIYYLLFFCSTVFYPLNLIKSLGEQGIIPSFLATLAEINPLSCGADLIRSFLLGTPPFTINLVFNVLAFSIPIIFISSFAYVKILQKQK
jgi:ABC-2 type transport system permease protein